VSDASRSPGGLSVPPSSGDPAGTDQPSTAPTVRPSGDPPPPAATEPGPQVGVASKPSLFAGLLAEANATPPLPGLERPRVGGAAAYAPIALPPNGPEAAARAGAAGPGGAPKGALQHLLVPPGTGRGPAVGAAPPGEAPRVAGPRGGGSFVALAASPPAPASPEGRTLGQYRVLAEIGSGGMAIVYKALQPALDRLVALKELRHELTHDAQIVARFEREATSLATLQHGNIVHIYDFIRDGDGAFIVMEFVEGLDLFDLLHSAGRLPPEVAAAIALQLAEGLEYAHYRGIIHRDVKPSNLLISKMGEVKIMDFGIARDPGRSELTQVGMALGTPAYMAPEQIRGDVTDARSDQFAAGIVLYEMLSGHKPWGDGEGTTVARKILYDEPAPLTRHVPDAPLPLVRIVERCLAKEPDKRFGTTHELRRALADYLAAEVTIDVRQRVVIYLRNRGLITDGDASSFVHPAALFDGVMRRRDLGLPSESAKDWLRPLVFAAAFGLLAAIAAGWWGAERLARAPGPLAGGRPTLELR
jgi:serine/threonine protein kinase